MQTLRRGGKLAESGAKNKEARGQQDRLLTEKASRSKADPTHPADRPEVESEETAGLK